MGAIKFSMRELLLVTLVIGLTLGWTLDRMRLSAQLGEAEGKFHSLVMLSAELGELLRGNGYAFGWRERGVSISGPYGGKLSHSSPMPVKELKDEMDRMHSARLLH